MEPPRLVRISAVVLEVVCEHHVGGDEELVDCCVVGRAEGGAD